jgi:hypothetical protein
VTCSKGLHFCALGYLDHFGSRDEPIMVVLVAPEDVVSIPCDYGNQKGRATGYRVVAELGKGALAEHPNELPEKEVYHTADDLGYGADEGEGEGEDMKFEEKVAARVKEVVVEVAAQQGMGDPATVLDTDTLEQLGCGGDEKLDSLLDAIEKEWPEIKDGLILSSEDTVWGLIDGILEALGY